MPSLKQKCGVRAQSGFPLHPLRLIYELRNLIGDDVTVMCDVGSHICMDGQVF